MTFSSRSRFLAGLSVFQTAARAGRYCPVCVGRGRIVEPNGDSNPCAACDGAGSFDMWECLTGNPQRVKASR